MVFGHCVWPEQNIYNVVDFGATGNGTNDDSEVWLITFFLLINFCNLISDYVLMGIFMCVLNAVLRAWKSVCGRKMGTAVLKFPAGRTYLLKPLLFQGPCLSNHVLIQVNFITHLQ